MDADDVRTSALLAEYAAVRTEMVARSGYQHQVIQLHLAALVFLLGATVSDLAKPYVLLILPITAGVFGLWYLDHALSIAELSRHIQTWTEPAIASAAGERAALRWETSYLRITSWAGRMRVALFRVVVAATFFAPAVAILLPAWLTGRPAAPSPATTAALLLVGTVLLALMVASFVTLLVMQHRQRTPRAYQHGAASEVVMSESPYVAHPARLADVVAAIQAMATYKFYKLEFAAWADRITGDAKAAEHWRTVFEQHPEFFRLDSERLRASLVWRRQHPKRYHVDTGAILSRGEFEALTDQQKMRVSRNPLGSSEVSALVKVAIDLHSRALEHMKERRWWIPLLAAFLGFVGAILGAYLEAL